MNDFSFVSLSWMFWMSVTTFLFWIAPSRIRMSLLSTISIFFLLVHDAQSAGLLLLLALITYLATSKNIVNEKSSAIAISSIVIILIFYKILAARENVGDFVGIIIPFGLSYYSLRCIHVILECYKGKLGVQNLQSLTSYLFFIPTLWIGPIHRFDAFNKDLRRHRWDSELFSRGLERTLFGYVKVTIIANIILSGVFSDWALLVSAGDIRLALYLEMLRVGLNLYILFSGYTDIAIGFGYLLGFRVLENFNWPYFQKNISDFWRSWHISLTSWCREYIYTFVIAKTRSPALGVIATLVVIGLWHEASIRYIAWGFYHGFGIVVWQNFSKLRVNLPTVRSKFLRVLLDLLSVGITLHFVWLGFLLVRQENLESMIVIIKTLFSF